MERKENKWWGPGVFSLRLPKKFSSQIGEKIERRKWGYLIDKNVHVHLHMGNSSNSIFFFFLISFSGCMLPSSSSSSFLCLTAHDFFLLDFYFLINWVIVFFLSLFCFNWLSFFNKGIWVNLYKLTFSIISLFYSQPNKNEKN